ncbi:MAG: LysR substrate-binding domain-containing protein [Lysobacteraceae bacterium]
MRAFVETVRFNSFAAAARALDAPRSKISKQIQALEDALGVQLLMRTTRSLHLTAAGAEYYESAREILAALEDAEQRARAGTGTLKGPLRINAPMSFGLRVLAPLLPEFHARHPELDLQIMLNDQLLDPIQGGYDVTVRVADLPDSSLAVRPIMPAPRVLVAAPAYLERAGTPQRPGDLERHAFLEYGYLQGGMTLALGRDGVSERVNTSGPLCSNNGDLLACVAEAGVGIALLPNFIVDAALREGRLVQVLPDWQAPAIMVNALFASARRVPLKTRMFIDFLVERLGHAR